MRVLKLACVTGAVMALAASSAAASGSFVLTATQSGRGVRVRAHVHGQRAARRARARDRAGVRRRDGPRPVRAGRLLCQARRRGEAAERGPAARQHPHLVDADLRRRRTAVLAERGQHRAAGASRSTCAPGVITTSATWTAPDGHVTKLAYQVLTDRATRARGPGAADADPAVVGHGDGHRRDRRLAGDAQRRGTGKG